MSANPAPSGDSHSPTSLAALFAAIFEHALDAILLIDETKHFVDANPAACRLLGYTRAEMRELDIADVTPEEDRPKVPSAWQVFQELGWFRKEWRLLAKDGTTTIVDMSCTANILPGIHLSIARDVTAQKKIEAEADLFRRALDALGSGIAITDEQAANRPIVYLNPAQARIVGGAVGELIGRECGEWIQHLNLAPIPDASGAITHSIGIQADAFPAPQQPPPSAVVPQPPRRGRILLVEDEEAVRRFIQLVLERANYTVIPTANGDEAIERYRADPDTIDLVLTDVVMPYRSGPELADELRRIRPAVRVAFMSGYTGGTAAHPIDFPADTPLLEKPFTIDRLLQVVGSAVATG
jgi:PAS domain S-box-containing protein